LLAHFCCSFYWRSRHVADKLRTIAILPFRPLVDQNRDEALELGMADTLITRLGNNSAITVRPLSSVRNFQGPDRDAINAGKALGVEAVLDPSIQRSGDRIRVNVTLIKVADGATIWADTFDKNFTDIFVVQDSIATSIVNALALNLNSEERTRLVKRYTSNPDALDYYNRGRVNELKITKEGLLKATNRHEEAIAEARRARELSPMTPLVFALESQILLRAGHTDDAILQAKKALD